MSSCSSRSYIYDLRKRSCDGGKKVKCYVIRTEWKEGSEAYLACLYVILLGIWFLCAKGQRITHTHILCYKDCRSSPLFPGLSVCVSCEQMFCRVCVSGLSRRSLLTHTHQGRGAAVHTSVRVGDAHSHMIHRLVRIPAACSCILCNLCLCHRVTRSS